MTAERAFARANPVHETEVRLAVPQEWSDATLAGILREPREDAAPPARADRRARLLVLVALALAVLAVPAYAIGQAVVRGWLAGEPAPQSAVDNFESYTPQLGYRPEPGKAVVVARDGAFDLYATTNDRGSYCVATSTPDGGICVRPSVAAAPLAAGTMPGGGRKDPPSTLVAGRVEDPAAVAIAFTDPDGAEVTRPIGAGGFFLAALPAVYECKNGGWTTTFRAFAANGDELAAAEIVLAEIMRNPRGKRLGCGSVTGPHT